MSNLSAAIVAATIALACSATYSEAASDNVSFTMQKRRVVASVIGERCRESSTGQLICESAIANGSRNAPDFEPWTADLTVGAPNGYGTTTPCSAEATQNSAMNPELVHADGSVAIRDHPLYGGTVNSYFFVEFEVLVPCLYRIDAVVALRDYPSGIPFSLHVDLSGSQGSVVSVDAARGEAELHNAGLLLPGTYRLGARAYLSLWNRGEASYNVDLRLGTVGIQPADWSLVKSFYSGPGR